MASPAMTRCDGSGPDVGHAVERIVGLAVVALPLPGEETEDARADLPATLAVADAVVEDPVEKWFPLLARSPAVAAGQPQHRSLDDVERVVAIPNRHLGDTECAPLDAGEKSVQVDRLLQQSLPGSAWDVGSDDPLCIDRETSKAPHERRLAPSGPVADWSMSTKTPIPPIG